MEVPPPKKVLLVDDDDFVRAVCLDLLTQAGFAVALADDGIDALNKLAGSVYDLVISDIKMPRLGGIDLFLRVEKDFSYLKERFLLMSGDVPDEPKARGVFVSLNHRVIRKPFRPDDLLNEVKELTRLPVAEFLNTPGVNRRCEERFLWVLDCVVALDGAGGAHAADAVDAKALDISVSGMRIRYHGETLFETGCAVIVSIKSADISRKGHVMWSRSMEGFSLAGLRLKESLPIASLMKGM